MPTVAAGAETLRKGPGRAPGLSRADTALSDFYRLLPVIQVTEREVRYLHMAEIARVPATDAGKGHLI